MPREKVLWIREPYLEQILSGRKTVEVRVAYANLVRLESGDILRLNDRYPVRIRRIGRYCSFEDLLAHEPPQAIAPDLNREALLAALRALYPPEKEALGVLALEVELLEGTPCR
ncbi:MAG: ASCH domain-containing protein [Chloroflexia bacterium]